MKAGEQVLHMYNLYHIILRKLAIVLIYNTIWLKVKRESNDPLYGVKPLNSLM